MWGDEFTSNDNGLVRNHSSPLVEQRRIESPVRALSGPSGRNNSCDIMLSDEDVPDESEALTSVNDAMTINNSNRINMLRSSFSI